MLKQSHFTTPRTMDEAFWVEGYGQEVRTPFPWHLVRLVLGLGGLVIALTWGVA